MEGFLLFVLVVVLIVRWAMLSRRYDGMERRIEMAIRERIEPMEITRLIRRITQLEETVAELKRGRAEVVVEAPLAAKPGMAAPPPSSVAVPGPLPPAAIPAPASEPKQGEPLRPAAIPRPASESQPGERPQPAVLPLRRVPLCLRSTSRLRYTPRVWYVPRAPAPSGKRWSAGIG